MVRRLIPLGARDADFGSRLQIALIAAVATVLVIRTQLWLTNYPQLGGGGLHIAHLLWGGLFMAITIGLLLIYLNRSIYPAAAILGGIGFGFFIDELGKFITEDNDYFFRPAASLIYLIFVGLFLLIRSLQQRGRSMRPDELVANAISILGGAADGDLNERDRRRALEFLERAGEETPLAASARAMLEEVKALPAPEPNVLDRIYGTVRSRYLGIVARPWFNRLVAWLVGTWAVLTLLSTVTLVLALFTDIETVDEISDLSFANWAGLVSSTISALLVLSGIRLLAKGRRVDAYERFEKAFLVAIFITSVFSFYESQFAAVFGLGINVLLLVTLRRMIEVERGDAERADGGSGTDGTSDTDAEGIDDADADLSRRNPPPYRQGDPAVP